LKGTPTADLQDPSPQICGTPHHKIAVPPTADLQSPYIEPEDNQKNNQKTTLAGQSPGEPPTASSAKKFAEENSNPEKQMKPKIEKGKNSVKDLLKEVHKKKILKPDTSKARVDTLINAMIEWDAAQGKTQIRAPLDGKQIGFLTNFATAMTAMGVLDPLEAITFGVTKWTHVRLAYMGANSDAKPPVNPDVFFLWTMRETVANQLRSSKTPKKQEAVASSVPSTQLTATPPAPPPKKKIATMEEMDAILTKAPAK